MITHASVLKPVMETLFVEEKEKHAENSYPFQKTLSLLRSRRIRLTFWLLISNATIALLPAAFSRDLFIH
jgi:hypothetical protein